MINWPFASVAAVTVIGIFVVVVVIFSWAEERRLRWEQAKDRLKGYHYDA